MSDSQVFMDFGYLYLECDDKAPGTLYLRTNPEALSPDSMADGHTLYYSAAFRDIDAAESLARMALKSFQVDFGVFEVEAAHAIAVIESLDVRAKRDYIDSDIEKAAGDAIAAESARREQRRERLNRIWNIVGWLGIGLLVAMVGVMM